MTGQRIEDLLKMKREDLTEDFFNFWNKKSKKYQNLLTNLSSIKKTALTD